MSFVTGDRRVAEFESGLCPALLAVVASEEWSLDVHHTRDRAHLIDLDARIVSLLLFLLSDRHLYQFQLSADSLI